MSLLTSDGLSLIKNQEGLKNHLAEYFFNLLNRQSTIVHDIFQQIPQLPVLNTLDQGGQTHVMVVSLDVLDFPPFAKWGIGMASVWHNWPAGQEFDSPALDLPLSAEEIKKVISQMNSNKATGQDGIPKSYKALDPKDLQAFKDILENIGSTEEVPDNFHDAFIVILKKNKRSKSDCRNYKGISLLKRMFTL